MAIQGQVFQVQVVKGIGTQMGMSGECLRIIRRPARLQHNEGGGEWLLPKSDRKLDPISYRALKAKVSLLEFSFLPVSCQIPLLLLASACHERRRSPCSCR